MPTARYYTRIFAENNMGGRAVSVEVLASSRNEARKKAIALGWDDSPSRAVVIVDRVEEIVEEADHAES